MSASGAELAPTTDAGPLAQSRIPRPTDHAGWISRGALLGYVALLFYLALLDDGGALNVRLEHLPMPAGEWIAQILLPGALACTRFLLLGILVALSIGRPIAPPCLRASVGRWLLLLLLGGGLFTLLRVSESGRWPGVTSFVAPMACILMGEWIGATLLRGIRSTVWLVPKLAALLVTLVAAVAGLAFLATEDAPLPFGPSKVTSAEKRRLAEVLDSSRRAGRGRQRLRLSQRDVNLLLAMAMEQALPEGKAHVVLDEEAVTGDLSARIFSATNRYLNVHVACRAGVTAGRLELQLRQLHIGRIAIPRFLLGAVSWALNRVMLDNADVQRVVATIDSVRVEPGGVEAVYQSGEFRDQLVPSLRARLNRDPDLVAKTRIHYRHLVTTARTLPTEGRFAAFVEAAFQLAAERSRLGDPVQENRAALLALGVLLGHSRVETLVGRVSDSNLRRSAPRYVGRVTLRRREDWRRHFLVSAALALLSNQSLSDEVGLFKEELDAGEGGSGFSFADLLADRAGTRFAMAATRDARSARRMQDRLANRVRIDDLFPRADDLPEGIPDHRLQTEYGGVGGEKYNALMQELDRRLATCAALK